MKIEWISCKERLPEVGDGFLVIVREKWHGDTDYCYAVDFAHSFGDYIDGFWDTYNDWCEGQEVHITHWAEIPKPDFDKISLEG